MIAEDLKMAARVAEVIELDLSLRASPVQMEHKDAQCSFLLPPGLHSRAKCASPASSLL